MKNLEQTLSIIKPDGVERNLIGKILAKFENENLKIVALKIKQLSKREAEGFYEIHKNRPFFGELVSFMTRSPVVISVLAGENAVNKNREIMGATNPKDAKAGTIRAEFAKSVGENTVHGSDSLENAQQEIKFFFNEMDILP